MTTARRPLLAALLLAQFSLAVPLQAQAAGPGPRLQYWITGGVGWGLEAHSGQLASHQGLAFAGAATLQQGVLVVSARSIHASPEQGSVWDAGLLAGVGSPAGYRMRGSVAAGIGRITGPAASAWTLPLELQLAWRLRPGLALAAYGFGSFTGPQEMLGVTLAVQLGRF
jgi:hypothetical protein